MDVALLSKIIKDIVLEKDSVGVPGVGTFIAELVPSTFSDKGYTINPPYRRLSFTRKTSEDGLLEERMAELGISGKQLTEFLDKLKGILMERKSVELPGLGRLRATRENHFFFVPDEDLDIWPEGFGLVSISLKNNQGFVDEEEEISPRAPLGRNDKESAPSPVISSDPSPVISSEGEAEVEKSLKRAPEATPCHTDAPQGPSVFPKKPRTLLIIIIVLVSLAALGLLALAILGRVAPDVADRLLYSPQELRTLKSLNL
ncbi:MAG: hypothetical protein J6X25_09670 [Bacteroidales bacterium]|nr:hypothetical protein [Bacteroidales bacterium]